MPLAKSPTLCPPMPSATAHSPRSAWSSQASSLISRTRPTWERAADVHRNWLPASGRPGSAAPSGFTYRPLRLAPLHLQSRPAVGDRADQDRSGRRIGPRRLEVDDLVVVDHLLDEVERVGVRDLLVEVHEWRDVRRRKSGKLERSIDPGYGATDGRHCLAVQSAVHREVSDSDCSHCCAPKL